MIENLTADLFRQKLAGLADEAGGEDVFLEEYRELASDFVLLLAIAFNRRELQAVTLWSRIKSAIQKGLAECDGIDVDALMSIALDHVLAPVNVVAKNAMARDIQSRLTHLPEERRANFCRYLSKHCYAAIVGGTEKWESHKELKQQIAELAKEEEGAE